MPKAKTSPEGPNLNPQQQASLVEMGKLMGDPRDDFDREVEGHLQRLGEASSSKMHAAQTGGASEPLGPPEIEQQQVKQRGAIRHQAAGQGALQAAQAQAQSTGPTVPPAPTGPVGTTQPYPAQAGPQPPVEQPAPAAPGTQAPPPEEEPEEQD